MRLCELTKIVPLLVSADYGAAGATSDSFCMKNCGHATLIFLFGAIVGSSDIQFSQGAADGETTADLPVDMAYTAIDIGSDGAETLGALANDSDGAFTLTEGTYEDRMLVVEIDGKTLTDGYDWVTFVIDSTATSGAVSCVAILSELRYAQDIPPTVLS